MKQISLLPKFANFCSVVKIIFASFTLHPSQICGKIDIFADVFLR